MDNKIYIDFVQAKQALDSLKKNREKMFNLIESICKNTNKMPTFWQGDVGTLAFERLNEFEGVFVNYMNDMDNRITFLENVINSYEEMDKYLNGRVDEVFSEGD